MKNNRTSTLPAAVPASSSALQFFKNTAAVDEQGNLVKVYHGSSVDFDRFNPALLGRGNDSWGNGFYFTTNEGTARGYANDTNSPTATVKEFYLNLKNPIFVDGKEHMSLDYRFNAQQAAALLKQHPDLYVQPDDEDRTNFLGDYAPSYWDSDHYTQEDFHRMVEEVAEQYFNDSGWVELETVYGREHGAAWLSAVRDVTGHDGVVVDFGEDGKHYVAWFPNQMKLTSNLNPSDDDVF